MISLNHARSVFAGCGLLGHLPAFPVKQDVTLVPQVCDEETIQKPSRPKLQPLQFKESTETKNTNVENS